MSESTSSWQQEAYNDALEYGVPGQLFVDVINAESGGNPLATNPTSGAEGIAQFLPSTAANPGYGIEPLGDPYSQSSALSTAAQYLAALYNKAGSWVGALNSYSGNTSGGLPYPGNNAIAADLNGLAGGGTGTPTGSTSTGTAATAGSSTNGCSSWISTPGACLTVAVTSIGFVILAIIVLGVGLWMLAERET